MPTFFNNLPGEHFRDAGHGDDDVLRHWWSRDGLNKLKSKVSGLIKTFIIECKIQCCQNSKSEGTEFSRTAVKVQKYPTLLFSICYRIRSIVFLLFFLLLYFDKFCLLSLYLANSKHIVNFKYAKWLFHNMLTELTKKPQNRKWGCIPVTTFSPCIFCLISTRSSESQQKTAQVTTLKAAAALLPPWCPLVHLDLSFNSQSIPPAFHIIKGIHLLFPE